MKKQIDEIIRFLKSIEDDEEVFIVFGNKETGGFYANNIKTKELISAIVFLTLEGITEGKNAFLEKKD